jgi:hypothetical protein
VDDMAKDFPHFDSEDEMREWFDTADLSAYVLDEALDVVVAHQVELSLDDRETPGASTAGATGTLRVPLHVAHG